MSQSKKTEFNSKIKTVKNKIPSISGLETRVTLNNKATEIEDKILVGGLVTKTDFNTKIKKIRVIQNKTPNIRGTVTTSPLYSKANEIQNKIPNVTRFITTTAFNSFAGIGFDAKFKKSKFSY